MALPEPPTLLEKNQVFNKNKKVFAKLAHIKAKYNSRNSNVFPTLSLGNRVKVFLKYYSRKRKCVSKRVQILF